MPNTVENQFKSYDEFVEINNNSNDRLEYIDQLICISPSPSIPHQRISGNLYFELRNFFNGKSCDVFSAPTDIELVKDNNKNLVIPDLRSNLYSRLLFYYQKSRNLPDLK